jgi:protease-4
MKSFFRFFYNVFRYIGKTISFVRNFFFNIVLLILVVLVVMSLMPETRQTIPDDSILRLDINGNIVEQKKILRTVEKLLEDSTDLETTDRETALQDILDVIAGAAEDKKIIGMLLNLENMKTGGLDQLLTIGAAIEEFRKSGKIVIASEDLYSQSQYLLASHADKIILNPMGAVDIHGFGVYKLYFKDALEKLKVTYNVFRVGSHKSAVEPFSRNSMSDEDRLQNELWLSALWQEYVDHISRQRELPPETIQSYPEKIAENLSRTGGDTARLALETGLVDELWTREEFSIYLRSLNRKDVEDSLISSGSYLETITPSYSEDSGESDRIGLIIAEGAILPGDQTTGFIGGESLSRLIRKARKDDSVKALVLRINSGGGSAFAAELIRQELVEVKKSGKPVVVSMGTVAASGGYWIAADADEIWASKATITGSIGIFGAIPTFDRSLEALGISSDGAGTSPLAAGVNLTRPLPEELKSAIQLSINHNYKNFVEIVANGRKLERSRVEKLAEGRVYDAVTAQNLGLVDQLGTLEDAIESAAKLAGLDTYSTGYIDVPASIQSQLLDFFSTAYGTLRHRELGILEAALPVDPDVAFQLKTLALLTDPRHSFAFCPVKLHL